MARALIVEDKPLFAIGLEADMHEVGFDTCDLAAHGHEAVLAAKNNRPAVALMDVNLEGDREGIEVAKRLREECGVPIVFITAYTDRDTVKRIRKEVPGAPLLPKPLWRDPLVDAAKAVMTFRIW
jgi:two-component system, response regulator PdtaR